MNKNIFPDIDRSKIDDFYRHIGANVKKERAKRGISQLELAILIGHKTTSYLSNCENYKNKEHFNLEHIFLISNILEIDPCQLLNFQE